MTQSRQAELTHGAAAVRRGARGQVREFHRLQKQQRGHIFQRNSWSNRKESEKSFNLKVEDFQDQWIVAEFNKIPG